MKNHSHATIKNQSAVLEKKWRTIAENHIKSKNNILEVPKIETNVIKNGIKKDESQTNKGVSKIINPLKKDTQLIKDINKLDTSKISDKKKEVLKSKLNLPSESKLIKFGLNDDYVNDDLLKVNSNELKFKNKINIIDNTVTNINIGNNNGHAISNLQSNSAVLNNSNHSNTSNSNLINSNLSSNANISNNNSNNYPNQMND